MLSDFRLRVSTIQGLVVLVVTACHALVSYAWAPALNSERNPATQGLGFSIRFLGLGLGLPFRIRFRIRIRDVIRVSD
jgi:hypothetical protein